MIPTRNRPSFLRKSLESILNQSYRNIEIIISDNFPETNETEEYINKIQDDRISYIRQKKLIPMSDHWNLLVNKANGDFICIYHDDDIYTENIVETSVNCFLEKENVLLCHVANRHFKDELEPTTDWEQSTAEGAPKSCPGAIHLAGRFGQWKYFWSDDCVMRGKQLEGIIK